MRLEPDASGEWTYKRLHAIQFSRHEMFYFTPSCSACKHDSLVSLELSSAIIFRCPRCEAEIDHAAVVAVDRQSLFDDFGWVVSDENGP